MRPRRSTAALMSAVVMAFLTQQASAEPDYPSRFITVISGFAPGSGADISTRFFAEQLAKRVSKPVVVENKLGSNGLLATRYVASSQPDGYTIFVAPGGALLGASPYLYKTLGFDPVKDFQSVTTLYRSMFINVVAADSPYRTVADLTAAMKQKGDKASYGVLNVVGMVASELYKSSFGLSAVPVNYGTVAGAVNDLVGHNIDFVYPVTASALGLVSSGKVRALATSSETRSMSFPDVPSAKESGIKGNVTSWWSVHVRAGTPTPIVDKLEAIFNEIVASKEAKEFLAAQGTEPLPGDRKRVDEMLVQENSLWAGYVTLAKIEKN